MSVWAELKRRNVFKVGAAYLILAWLLAQVASLLVPNLGLPGWIVRFVILILILGFPLALFLAWAYELTPEGIKQTKTVPSSESVQHVTGQRLNYVVTGLLVLAVAAMALDSYVLRRPAGPSSGDAAPRQEGIETAAATVSARVGPLAGRLPNSVAVLPFDNLSADPEHAYFAFGIHEEVLNQLAKIKSLTVISRTSVARYGTDRPPIPEIAAALNVAAVMEGSVRYAGNRILVTVQLIDAATDSHIWSDSYPGDLSDLSTVFALQADIATNVANALRAELTPAELASIERPITASTEAYEYYLAAREAARPFTLEGLTRALELIDAGLELDPAFAEAWMSKGNLHNNIVQRVALAGVAEQQALAEAAIRRALELAPTKGEAYAQLGYALSQRRPVEAERAYRRASELGGANLAVAAYSIFLLGSANFEKAAEINAAELEVDPLNWIVRGFQVAAHTARGDVAAAIAEYERGRMLYGEWPFGREFVQWLHLGAGDTQSALEFVSSAPIDTAARENIQTPSAALAALLRVRPSPETHNQSELTAFAMWAAYFGDAELAFDAMQELVGANTQNTFLFWYPQMRAVRALPGFKTVMRAAGFVDYWDEFGWPEACRRTARDDFDCE